MDEIDIDKARCAAGTTGKATGYICLSLMLVMAVLAVIYSLWFFVGFGLSFVGFVGVAFFTRSKSVHNSGDTPAG